MYIKSKAWVVNCSAVTASNWECIFTVTLYLNSQTERCNWAEKTKGPEGNLGRDQAKRNLNRCQTVPCFETASLPPHLWIKVKSVPLLTSIFVFLQVGWQSAASEIRIRTGFTFGLHHSHCTEHDQTYSHYCRERRSWLPQQVCNFLNSWDWTLNLKPNWTIKKFFIMYWKAE